jgi:hypothetical protein
MMSVKTLAPTQHQALDLPNLQNHEPNMSLVFSFVHFQAVKAAENRLRQIETLSNFLVHVEENRGTVSFENLKVGKMVDQVKDDPKVPLGVHHK